MILQEQSRTEQQITIPTPSELKKCRFVVVEVVNYQEMGKSPSLGIDTRYSHDMKTTDIPYRREVVVSESWEPLEFGWLQDKGVSMILLENLKDVRRTYPTKEEVAQETLRVIEAGTEGGDMEVQPFSMIPIGESIRLYPPSCKSLRMRCQNGPARMMMTAFPE